MSRNTNTQWAFPKPQALVPTETFRTTFLRLSLLGTVIAGGAAMAERPVQTRTISMYSSYYEGRKMANGQRYRSVNRTVAANDWPLGTMLSIQYKGRMAIVRVTDRMAGRYTGRRVDASASLWYYLAGSAARKPGLLKGARVQVLSTPKRRAS